MAKSYRKADNCGPVPYPSDPEKMLQEGETVTGDEWEPLVALGFVVAVEDGSETVEEPKTEPEPESKSEPESTPEPEAPEAEAAPVSEDVSDPKQGEEVSDDGMREADERSGAEGVDTPTAGEPGGEGVSGRATARRRSRRS